MLRLWNVIGILVCAVLLLAGAPAWAQALPDLPMEPYVREHEEALLAHLAAARRELDAAREGKIAAEKAALEPGLPEDEIKKRQEAARIAAETEASLAEKVKLLDAALKAARAGPTAAQLAARREYDRLLKLGDSVLEDLIAEPRAEKNELEGRLAKAIREAEEELARIERLSEDAREFDGPKSRLYQRLSESEKFDYELRWAEQRLKLAIDEYDYLVEHVFPAYVAYEERGIAGLRALHDAREVHFAIFNNTPAAALPLPAAARPLAELDSLVADIELRTERRRGRALAEKMRVTRFAGRLREIQQEIDEREDFKDRLDQEAGRVKDRIAATPENENGGVDEKKAEPAKSLAEYQELSKRIDDLEAERRNIQDELRKLDAEHLDLQAVFDSKFSIEKDVGSIVAETQRRITALEAEFKSPADAPPAEQLRLERERNRYFPHIRLAAWNEQLGAELERESAAKRDTRYALTRMEVLQRRRVKLTARASEIENQLLPQTRASFYESLAKTVGLRALLVLAVIIGAWLLIRLIRKASTPLIQRYVARAGTSTDNNVSDAQRGRTLITVMTTTTRVVVFVVAAMVVLYQFDLDYGPLLVAAGGVSLAVGFGAQTLVKDFFAGFFILLEGQYSIGDVVEINGKTGTIENLNLRTTVIRALNGDVHTIPNGEISLTTNQTKLWSRSVIDIGVAYEENVDDMISVLDAVAKGMEKDEVWGRKVLESVIMGVQSLGESAVIIRVLLKTRAGEQWGAEREFQRRVKVKFDELGIEIPWPQRVVSHKRVAENPELATRKKRVRVLRYIRSSRGEAMPEEAELAAMSVEERDRAEAMAKHKVSAAQPAATVTPPVAASPEQKPDAERLAEKLSTRIIEKPPEKAPEPPPAPPGASA